MPIIRYFLFAGAFVVALLFVLDCNLPAVDERSAGPEVDRSIIRIHSARALPEKIIFDTSTEIAAPISSPVLAAAPPDRAASNAVAIAELPKPKTKIAAAPRRSATQATGLRSNRATRSASSRRLYDRQVMVETF